MSRDSVWPTLPYSDWKDTCLTLHLWTQIVGKVRTALSPWINHSWQVPLYVTVEGLSSSSIPHGDRSFEIRFDFHRHEFVLLHDDGRVVRRPIRPMSVAAFHAMLMESLSELGLSVKIHPAPNELPEAIPFAEDEVHASYDADAVHRFWRVLLSSDRVFRIFRSGYLGKVSPVHFFWGSFDLALTRFSGREAPLHPGGLPNLPDPITREAYSHEVSSAGFWPGGGFTDYPAYYSYAYPVPEGFAEYELGVPEAFYHAELGEYLLPYEAVRTADDPDALLLRFLQSTYEAAATLGGWDRASLECAIGVPGVPRRVG